MTKSITEATFQTALLRAINAPGSGMRGWRQNAGNLTVLGPSGKRTLHLAPKGAADIVGIADGGLFFEAECKSAYGRLSEEQKAHGDLVRDRGGVWVCCSPTKHETLEQAVTRSLRELRGAIGERQRAALAVIREAERQRLRGGDGSTTPPGAPYGTGAAEP